MASRPPKLVAGRTIIPKAMIKLFEEQPLIIDLRPFPGLMPIPWERLRNAATLKAMLENKEIMENYEVILVEKQR